MIGTEIGGYRIVDNIGAGGMGVVYKALDVQLERVVAIKALNPELSGNPTLLERFRREARAQAQLNHPNLATLYAFLMQDGVAYMVMEFVDGETLYQMLGRRGAIPPQEALPLFRQALAGIGYAHRAGIVHRDIKPSNIMLNREGVVKVMDFGLAKTTANHGMTRTGVRLGTAYYMSPEQVLVKATDARSDIYSLGATFYEMLTGKAPFDAASEFEILNDHVNTAPPRPSGMGAALPPALENAVMKALSKDPDQRFQTAEEFSAALEYPAEFHLAETVADGAPVPPDRRVTVASTPPTSPGPIAPPVKKRPLLPLVIGGVLVVCLVAVWLVFQARQRPVSETVAKPPQLQSAPATAAGQPVPPLVAEAPKPSPMAPPPAAVPAAPVEKTVVAADTEVAILTVDPIDSKASRVDQEFEAKLAADVDSGANQKPFFHADDKAHLRLGQTASGGSSKKEFMLELASISAGGKDYPVRSNSFLMKGSRLPWSKNRLAPGTAITFRLRSDVKALVKQP